MISLKNNAFLKEKSANLPSVSIRRCTEEDINRLENKEETKSTFRKDLEDGHIMIGAFLKDDIVAYVWLSFQKVYAPEMGAWADFDGGYIWRGHTKKEFRGKGIGKEVDRYALKIAKELKKEKVYVLVETDNIPAQRTLESVGFKKQKIISYCKFFNLKKRSDKKI